MKRAAFILLAGVTFALSGCGGGHATRGSGGYYLDDGPGKHVPANLDKVPDAVPKAEPIKTGTTKPYTVLGKTYTPMTALRPYKARGVASWYGTRYHGEKTSSGEIYDMYKMTAAHPILPIPSYARVTNLDNGKSVIVRINDRGPFLESRLIDLSYAAAYKLDIIQKGSGHVEVESILPGEALPPPPTVASAPTITPAQTATTIGAPISAPAPTAAVAAPVIASAVTPASSTPADNATPANDAPAVVEMERGPQGVFLQLGAFGSQDNAERYAEQLRTQADWLASAVQVYSKNDGIYRVHAGPFADPNEAKEVAERLNQSLGIQAIVVTR